MLWLTGIHVITSDDAFPRRTNKLSTISTVCTAMGTHGRRPGRMTNFLGKRIEEIAIGNCTGIASWRMCWKLNGGDPFLSKVLPNWPTAARSRKLCNCNYLFPLEIMLIFAILGISNVLAEARVWSNTSSRMICDNFYDSIEHEDSSIFFQLFD